MTEWQKCLTATDCFSMAYYNADGSVDDECKGKLNVEDIDKASAGSQIFSLQCGNHKDVFIKDENDNLINGKIKIAPPAENDGLAILRLSVDTTAKVSEATEENSGSSPVFANIRTTRETIVMSFANFAEYQQWFKDSGIPGSEVLEKQIRKIETSQTPKKTIELRFTDPQSFKDALRNETFIFNGAIYSDRTALKDAISKASSSAEMSFIRLANGERPTAFVGKPADILAYAESLVQKASCRAFGKADVEEQPPKGDIRISIGGSGGYSTNPTVELEGPDAAAAADNKRSKFGGPEIEVGGHYWYHDPKKWLSLGFGAKDAISFEFGPESTAYSKIFTNRFVVDPLSLRFNISDKVNILIEPLGFGCYTVDGIDDTLGDTGMKHNSGPTTYGIYNFEAGVNVFVSKNVALSFTGGLDAPIAHKAPVTGHGAFGVTVMFGRKQKYNGISEVDVEAEQCKLPEPADNTPSTKIEVPPKAIKPLEYRELPPTALVLPPLDTNAIFEPNKADLKTESIEGRQINRGVYDVVKAVKDYKARLDALGIGNDLAVELTLEAFADSQGSVVDAKDRTKGNQPLSEARIASFAGAVEAELKARNIVGVTIRSKGRGEEEPVLHACVMTTGKKSRCDVKATIKGSEVTITDVPGLELLPEGFYDANGDRVPGYYYNGNKLCTPSPTKTCQSAAYGSIRYKRNLTAEEKAKGVRARSIPEVQYVEDLQKSRRLKGTAVPAVSSLNITPNENADNLKDKAAFELQGVNIKAVSVPLVLTAPLPATMNEYFTANVIPNFAGIVQHLSREEGRNEIILTVNIKDGKDADTKCGYLSLIAGMFSNGKPVRVMVSTDPNYSDSVIVTAGENTNIIKPEVTTDDPEDSGTKLRKYWLNMIRGVKAE